MVKRRQQRWTPRRFRLPIEWLANASGDHGAEGPAVGEEAPHFMCDITRPKGRGLTDDREPEVVKEVG